MATQVVDALLLVDGYNAIGQWPVWRETSDRDGLAAARQELIEALLNYSAFKSLSTHVVFDAQYRQTAVSQEAITDFLSVTYTDFGQTADTYIEKTCANYWRERQVRPQRVIVATSDHAQKMTAIGYGAEWMSSRQLAQDIEFTHRQIRQVNPKTKRSGAGFLAGRINHDVRQQLDRLRYGLP